MTSRNGFVRRGVDASSSPREPWGIEEIRHALTSRLNLARCLRDFCVFRSALLCSVVPNATDATRILLIKSKLNFQSLRYEPGGREFESLRARQLQQRLSVAALTLNCRL